MRAMRHRARSLGTRLIMGLLLLIFVLLLQFLLPLCSGGDAPPPLPGHMQPLGSHREPELVPMVAHIPSPLEFREKYVKPGKPVVMKGVMAETEVLGNWQSDDYLRSRFGGEEMNAEKGKKENRSEVAYTVTMSEFLDRYQQEDLYMVSAMHEAMKQEWLLPKFLLCGGYTTHLMFVYLWFSSGGTKSVLHTDTYENLHCLVSGRKEFVLIEPKYSRDIGPEHEHLGFYHIDVERVNMTAYPGLADVPWHLAVVNPGDCLYLPYSWIHHVRSYGRNFGVNVWWIPFQFNGEECTGGVPDFAPLGDFQATPELELMNVLREHAREDGTIHAEDIHRLMNENPGTTGIGLLAVRKMFELLKPGCNGFLDISDLNSISMDTYKTSYEYILQVHEELVINRMDEQDNTGPSTSQEPQHDHVHAHTSRGHESHHPHTDSNLHHNSEDDYDYFWPWEDTLDEDGGEFGGFSHLDYDYDDPEHMEELGGGRSPLHTRDEL